MRREGQHKCTSLFTVLLILLECIKGFEIHRKHSLKVVLIIAACLIEFRSFVRASRVGKRYQPLPNSLENIKMQCELFAGTSITSTKRKLDFNEHSTDVGGTFSLINVASFFIYFPHFPRHVTFTFLSFSCAEGNSRELDANYNPKCFSHVSLLSLLKIITWR